MPLLKIAQFLICGALCSLSAAQHPSLVEREFTHTQDVGFGNSVFLVGDAEILGAGVPEEGVKMRFTAGNVWRATVAVPSNSGELGYQFVSRSTDPSVYCSSANATTLATGFSLPVDPTEAAPYSGKTVYYHSAWPQVNILYFSESAGTFVQEPMVDIGAGREAGERHYKLSGIGEAGSDLIFVFNDGAGQWDNAFSQPGVNYQTKLDFIFVQDGNVFNYRPEAVVSAPRFETRNINSTAPGIDGREIKIYLPRGYDSHPTRRYPVLYMHDGQNVFAPGGAFGSWDVDLTIRDEIQMGRVRESIVVGINNTAARLSEYLSPTDSFGGFGRCDDYADFVINNVRPALDLNYRTLNDPANTVLMGSSFGGIATVYMGWAHDDVFGKLGVLSPSWWAIPQLRNQMRNAAPRSERIYLYWGTEESSGSANAATWWPPFLDGYDIYLSQGYSIGGSLLTSVGCGLDHNEAAWASQMETALRYLLDINDTSNELAFEEESPSVSLFVDPGVDATIEFSALSGFRYQIETTVDLGDPDSWELVMERSTDRYWEKLSVDDAMEPFDLRRFYRVRLLVN